MLRWAREQAGCSLEQAGKAAGRDAGAVAAWESAESGQLPTVRQAQNLARAYRVPFAMFYMTRPTPDLEREAVPEFRRLDPETGSARPQSRQLRWMIRQAQERQAFAIELMEDDGESPLSWVGSASLDEDPEALGGRIRKELGVLDDEPEIGDKERVLDWWVERVENLGAFVSRYRPDGNQHWFVEPSEARGLSLCHPLAPYIVLNSRDAPAARTFTLMHELSHIYYGHCGVDDISDEQWIADDDKVLERRCNQVAAAVLMPSARFRREWSNLPDDLADTVSRVADVFGVSRLAVAVRARSDVMRFISEEQLIGMRRRLNDEYREFRDSRPTGGNGGMAPSVLVSKDLGGRFAKLVFDAYADGRLSRLEVAEAFDARMRDIEGIRSRL
jgi:Zn-dependent peptidase ImmA (M78 family)